MLLWLGVQVGLLLDVRTTPDVLFGLSRLFCTKLHAYRNRVHSDGSYNGGISAGASQLGPSQTSSDMLADAPLAKQSAPGIGMAV